MADVNIKYKGNTIAEMSSSGTKTLNTANKYCEDSFTLEYAKKCGAVEISTRAEMLAVMSSGNIGKLYLYTGTTDSDFTNGKMYRVCEQEYKYEPEFVCVGSSGKSYYSTDGETWIAMSGLDSSNDYHAVTYGNGRFVCVRGYIEE